VSPSGGQSGFIESPSEVIEYLQKRIKGLGAIYAQNLRLQKTFPKSMSLQYGFKLEPFAQPLSVDEEEIKLGNLEGLSPLSFLLEINVEPQPIETRVNIPLTFAANIPAQQMREKLYKSNYSVYVLADASQVKPPEALVKAVRTLNMYRMNEKVWEEVEAGRLDVAATRMKNLSTRLLQEGEEQLAHQATIELERIANAGTMSLEGRKKLKYGTRALINQTIQRDEND
jgi:Ca-activated chloride channel family protein